MTASGPRAARPRFFYVNVVWGPEYIDLFTQYSIPTLLAPGNLPSVPNRDVSEFLIIAPEEEAARIRASAIFPRLADVIEVVFIPITITTEHKIDLMTHGHRLAVDYVARRGYCIFLAPDTLLSNGMLTRLFELASGGRRVVAGFGPRVNEETVVDELRNSSGYREGEALSLESARLVELAMRHLHSDTRHHFVDSDYFPDKPYACIWQGPAGDGILVRSLNLHPYLFDCSLIPENESIAHLTIDWYLIPRFVTDWNDFYVEKDSDNFCIVSLTPATVRAKPAKSGRLDPEALSLWLLRNRYALLNRTSFLYPIVFHTRPLDAEWSELVRRTGEFALEVADPNGATRASTLLGHALLTQSTRGAATENGGKREGAEMGSKPTVIAKAARDLAQAEEDPTAEPIPFFYGFSVWGERYVDYLCRFALPSLLSPRNLPALPNNDVSSFVIATTPEDERRLRSRDIFRLLTRFINVQFVYLRSAGEELPTESDRDEKYKMLSLGHSMAADLATGRGYALFLAPDAIYSDGMLSRLHELAASGKSAVVGMGPRVVEETIVPELTERGLLRDDEPLVLQPRESVGLLLRHLHEDARLQRWTSPLFPHTPYMCVWDVGGGDGVLLRCLTLHPYLVDYRTLSGWRGRPHETSAVDASFIIDCHLPWEKIYQVTDTDDFMILSLTSMHHRDYPRTINTDPFRTLVASVQRHDVTMLHRAYFMNAIKMHTGDLDHRWAQLERETLKIAYDVFQTANGGGYPKDSIEAVVEVRFEAEREAFITRIQELESDLEAKESAYARLIADVQSTSEAEREAFVARIRELESDLEAKERAYAGLIAGVQSTAEAEREALIARIRELEGDRETHVQGISGRVALLLAFKKLAQRLGAARFHSMRQT